jgi:hypothetical protein
VCTATERQNEPPEDRRQSPRIRLRDAQIIVSWDQGSEHVTCDGQVLDISGGGARVLVDRAPPAGVSIRLHFGRRLAAMEPLEARCLAISGDDSARHLVRVQFMQWVSLDAIVELHHERRLWQRFPVRETRAKLTLIEDGSEKTIRGKLLNLGGGGAAIIVDVICPADEPLWFELDTDSGAINPVESRLVVTSLDPSGLKIARIKFIDPCPILLFELAIHGSTS